MTRQSDRLANLVGPFSRQAVALAAQTACVREVCAPKPGNVNRLHDFADTRFEDFVLSAMAIGPAMLEADRLGVGQIIQQAVCDTRQLVQSNTNLGIILLLAPLAKACRSSGAVHENLRRVLAALTVEDARHTYAAIRMAQPGGMGQTAEADVSEEPSITLLQAMELAQGRDALAREYVTDYAITFEIGHPALREAWQITDQLAQAIVQCYLTLLAKVPDTLIARKRGLEAATEVSRRAAETLALGGVLTAQGQDALADLDRRLRDEHHTLNPGATADLTTAALFLFLLRELPSGTMSTI
jgi:triphosphoribosyl-dephospho-CoA synthase